MSRGTAPRLAMIALASAALLPFAASADAAPPQEVEVLVADFKYEPADREVVAGDTVKWVLDSQATTSHSITLDANGDGQIPTQGDVSQDLVPGTADTTFSWRFDKSSSGPYQYFCRFHPASMRGQVLVNEAPPPPTTTTTEPPTTTTTTAPAPTTTTTMAPPPTTTTTRPRSTTTTTRPAATPTTQPPASASDDEPDTTNTTARATTTTGKATTTTGKKKPTTTTKPPETTTTSAPPALPADWIPTPEMSPDGSPTTTTTAPELQAAAGHRPKSGKGGGFPVTGAAGALAVLLLGGGGWAWYHRSSRYLPA